MIPVFTPQQIATGIQSSSVGVKLEFVENANILLTEQQMILLANDKEWTVRAALANRPDISTYVVDILLQDKNSSVLEALAFNFDITFNVRQLMSGLTNIDDNVVSFFIQRPEFTPSDDCISCELNNESATIRMSFAKKTCYVPTLDQVEQGLSDPSWMVRLAFAEREDVTFTKQQIERGLNDDYEEIRLAFVISNTLSVEQLDKLVTDKSPRVREAVSCQKNLTDKHIEQFLEDSSASVRYAFVKHSVKLTMKHVKQALEDDDTLIAELIKKIPEYSLFMKNHAANNMNANRL